METETRRPLRRAERALVYAGLGWAMEVGFTGVARLMDGARRDWRLMGHSYLWMGPLYGGVAFFYEPLHERLRGRPAGQRAIAYAAGFLAAELGAGLALKRLTGLIPWDYTGHGHLVIRGATRLDYAPLWALCGFGLERVHDELLVIPMRRVR